MNETDRLIGVGTLEQVRDDLHGLAHLGAEHVLLDWYLSGDMESARDDERAWRMLSLLAEQVIDLPNQRLR